MSKHGHTGITAGPVATGKVHVGRKGTGVDQLYCEHGQMAARIVEEATVLLEQELRRTEEALSLGFERRDW